MALMLVELQALLPTMVRHEAQERWQAQPSKQRVDIEQRFGCATA